MEHRLIIAIDGPAASGKSTTAQRLALRLGYVYLDTGATYRACALQAQLSGVSLDDAEAVAAMLETIDIRIETSGATNVILLEGRDVSEDIRANAISKLSSDISALPAVRYRMVELQRRMGAQGGGILDGRDMGRELAHLPVAKDAIVIDTGDMSVDEKVDTLHSLVLARQEGI